MAGQSGRRRGGGRKTRRRRAPSENRLAMLAILTVVCLLFIVLLVEGVRLQKKIDAGRERHAALSSAMASEKKRTKSIESYRAYLSTDEYAEQAAKDRLGLVESGELVLRQAES